MAYKLAEEDKLCGVIYPTYEGFSPIPKVTCDMLEPKCDQTIVVKCGEPSEEETVDRVLGEIPLENLPTTEIGITTNNTMKLPDESTVENFKKVNKANLESKLGKGYTVEITVEEPNKVGEPYTEEIITIEITTPSGKKVKRESLQKYIAQFVAEPVLTDEEIEGLIFPVLSTNKELGHIGINLNIVTQSVTEATPEEIDRFKSSKVEEVSNIDELKDYKVEVVVDKRKELPPKVGEEGSVTSIYNFSYKITKPNGDVYISSPYGIPSYISIEEDYDRLIPNVEPFSEIYVRDGQVVEVAKVTEEDKTAYENKVIEELKKKLFKGTTVKAKLEGPKYNKGDEIIEDKTNYNLNVKFNPIGIEFSHTYNVPHNLTTVENLVPPASLEPL